ncbi:hypothetical protein NLJ89_g3393 [Agrocybe chaxingu]|uniref:SHSP domain-containing protein n=1 Tax=Agrocybe chaxingu TaxID=84603 RepID=A0A9W8K2K0_9AGAR|nr:hypothetical protein NLJ89_g3393 [Agrocybe chaxingu]
MPSYPINRQDERNVQVVLSPVTPAVTGIDYPSTDDISTDYDTSYHPARALGRGFYTHPNIGGSTIEDVEPPVDAQSLDLVWGSIRQKKEQKMAKEAPKVRSLHPNTFAADHAPMQIPLMESPPTSAPKSIKKQKSISNFRESTDGRAIVATFDIPNSVDKQNIHISFQRNKLVLTWHVKELVETEDEDGVPSREYLRTMYNRTLPLPEGTRFEEIHAQMSSRGLTLRYPNMRCHRVDGRSRSGDS